MRLQPVTMRSLPGFVAACGWILPTACLAASPVPGATAPVVAARSEAEARAECRPSDCWVTLLGEEGPVGFTGVGEDLAEVADARFNPKTQELETTPGAGVVAATRKLAYGDENNLLTIEEFGDCEVSLEFLLGEGSNAGVKLQQRYEVQLYDSQGKSQLTGTDCGGVYPHWIFANSGHGITYIDKGVPPLVNAAKAPGEWQALRIAFKAPAFDPSGSKVEDARFVRVELNGEVVQRDVSLPSPTGNASTPLPEVAEAPLYLQLDHGPVAFRNVRVKPL